MRTIPKAILPVVAALALGACAKPADEDAAPKTPPAAAQAAATPVVTKGEIPGPGSAAAAVALAAPVATPEDWRNLLAAAKKADELGNAEQAEALHREALAETERLGLLGPQRDQALNELGYFLYFKGRLDEAIPVFEQMARERDAALLVDLHKLGNVYAFAGEAEKASAAFDRAVEIARRIEHPTAAQVEADREAMRKKFGIADETPVAPPPPPVGPPVETLAPPDASAAPPEGDVVTVTTGEAPPPAPEPVAPAPAEPADAEPAPAAPSEAPPAAEPETATP